MIFKSVSYCNQNHQNNVFAVKKKIIKTKDFIIKINFKVK